MICAVCDQPNDDAALACARCATPLPAAPPGAGPGETVVPPSAQTATLAPEASAPAAGLLGPRYEILRLLGRGGMGDVYLARDRELARDVAVKVIAAHLAHEAWVVERFKREIQLSSLVTHPNVLRVFDLADHGGLRFLTMQYIEGGTLADVLQGARPLPVERAVALFRQLCEGVGAAHALGVVHRDLKPQNVMVDAKDHVYVTDFGLATSSASASLTRAGALMGTPHYMSPEQVKGEPVDARSDVFSAGVILHELLAGELPFDGATPFEVMLARTRPPPRRARDVNPSVPEALQRVIDRCLAVERAARYASFAAVLAELDARERRSVRRQWRRGARVTLAAVAAAAVALALAIALPFAARRLGSHPPPAPGTRKVLVADLENGTGEGVFDGTLEPALALALEGASFVSSFPRAAAQRLADRLGLEGSALGEKRARLVAQREGVHVVTSGAIRRGAEGYRVTLRALDAFTGAVIVEATEVADGKEAVLAAATKLAARVRTVLGDATPEAVQLKEAETFSAASLESAHEYARGMTLQAEGNWDEAKARYLAALKLDPGLGRAYSGLAIMEANRNRHAEAERWFKEALAHADRMTEREKWRSRGAYYLFTRDAEKAVEAFRALVEQYPADSAGLANLALAYVFTCDFTRALDVSRRAVEIYPGNVPQRNNVGFFAMYAGDLEGAIREQAQVLGLNPAFVNGHIGLALAELAAGRRDAAVATWKKAEALGADGASAAAEGLADLALYEGRIAEARALAEAGIEADLARGDGDAAARKLVLLAEARLAQGSAADAAAAAERALRSSRADGVTFLAGRILAETGREKRARALADDLERRLGAAPKAYAEILRSTVALGRRDGGEAIARAKAAVQHLDSWLARYALGRAYLEAGAFPEAQDELERCEKRRGEATDVFIDNVPTFRLYRPVPYHLARAAEGLASPGAAAAYRTFLAPIRSDEDPLVQDARRRLQGK